MGFDVVTNSITKCIDRVENRIGAFLQVGDVKGFNIYLGLKKFLIKLFYLHTIFILKFMHLMCK